MTKKLTMERPERLTERDLLEYAEKVVNRYVITGVVPEKDREDVQMSMVEKFLSKKERIFSAFEGKSRVKTYCFAVLNRMCCEIIRKELRHWKNKEEEEPEPGVQDFSSSSSQVVIEAEIKLLDKVLLMFDDEKPKVILFLKYFFEIPITELDARAYLKEYYEPETLEFLTGNEKLTDSRKYQMLQHIVAIREERDIKPDAIRMWINKTIQHIIARLNCTIQRSNYTKESLGILMEYMYTRQTNQNYEKVPREMPGFIHLKAETA
jgi:DNA-directed RNA polymerase specialized sigma24 family protein